MSNDHLRRVAGAPDSLQVQTNSKCRETVMAIPANDAAQEILDQLMDKGQPAHGPLRTSDTIASERACLLCKEDSPILTGENLYCVITCGHVFCYECALRWVSVPSAHVNRLLTISLSL